MELTREQILEVPCITCDAKVGKPCMVDPAHPMVGYHRKRTELRERFPNIPTDLNATDKALIVYYAYVMLCDSCEANSEKLFGKVIPSAEIQRMFARRAVAALKEDGLIK